MSDANVVGGRLLPYPAVLNCGGKRSEGDRSNDVDRAVLEPLTHKSCFRKLIMRARRGRLPMVRWLSQVGYAWRRHGPIGLCWLIGYNIAYHVSGRARHAAAAQQMDAF